MHDPTLEKAVSAQGPEGPRGHHMEGHGALQTGQLNLKAQLCTFVFIYSSENIYSSSVASLAPMRTPHQNKHI